MQPHRDRTAFNKPVFYDDTEIKVNHTALECTTAQQQKTHTSFKHDVNTVHTRITRSKGRDITILIRKKCRQTPGKHHAVLQATPREPR